MHDPLLRFRDEFPILSRSTYMVSNSLGAMPRTVPGKLAEYAESWATWGVRAWARGWWEMPMTVGDVVAPLMGAAPSEVVMAPTVTLAQSAILSALDFTVGRDTVVMTDLDFPSVRYAFEELVPKLGGRVVVVPTEDGITIDQARLHGAIDERTALVAVSHVAFRSAFILDADALCAHAHAMGALVSLDAYHSVGVIPVDVKRSGVDFLTGGVLKWLCGGPGGCFLYASPSASERFAPSLTGWQAHKRPFAFEYGMDYAEGIHRWLGGTPVVPALYAGMEGPRIVAEAGMAAIREKSIRQTARLVALADARGYKISAPREPDRRGGTVAFDVPHGAEVAQALLARDVVIDYRPGAGIRVAPHFYTTDDEVERVVAEIDDILSTGAWSAFAGSKPRVT
ncbi:MAG: aminotransferase class V-fold PLP-dependent enzyme [Gemmatimonadetes bacterium]|jgi:kynureninase|nr:aminotransferase class V-fold PLP-dependent enzyme [Gemmatimonadota bacterium]MBP7549684.1 aminotransferase class V-fold PLP-dependent enzyme [Gemmatimonadaceae bacterium]